MAQKERLDVLVHRAGLAESIDKAQRLIQAGQVRIAGHPSTKPGYRFSVDILPEVIHSERFVSRGGKKLEGAFEAFGLSVEGLICLDVGASTGGFSDCLLQHGATHVVAVDVGRGQLHWKLRTDERVTVMEGFNARYLAAKDLELSPQFAVTDVSFISLKLILPPMADVIVAGSEMVSLIKPQFEAARSQVGRGGVVRDEGVRRDVVERVRTFGTEELGLEWLGCVESPITGPKGNVEFLAHWRKPGVGG